MMRNPQRESQSALLNLHYFLQDFKKVHKVLGIQPNSLACSACKVSLDPSTFLLTNPVAREVMEWLTKEVCIKFGIEGGDPSVCKGAIDTMANFLLPALAKGPLSPQTFCDEFMGVCKSPVIDELSADAFAAKRISEKPAIIKNNDFVDNLYKKIKADPNPRSIKRSIQLSDLHIDTKYEQG